MLTANNLQKRGCGALEQKKDLRVKRTKKLVFDSMLNLMLRRKFEQITVYELCETAQISRATFYVHFEDKYDLLKVWLTGLATDAYNNAQKAADGKKSEYINGFVRENRKVIENLLSDASDETLEIIFEIICGFLKFSNSGIRADTEYIVLSNIYAGGMLSYMKWQIKNRFPKDTEVSNEYLYGVIKDFLY